MLSTMASECAVTRGNQPLMARCAPTVEVRREADREGLPPGAPARNRPAAAPCSQTPARGREERVHALREQAQDHAAEHVAGAGGRQARRGVRVDDGAAVRRSDHRIGALQHHDGADLFRRGASARQLVAGDVKQARELTLVRCDDAGTVEGPGQSAGIVRKHADGIWHRAAPRGPWRAWPARDRGSRQRPRRRVR